MYHSTYYGCNIFRKTTFGYSLPWTAFTPKGQVAADTLAGIRELIRENVCPLKYNLAK